MMLVAINQNFTGSPVLMIPEMDEKVCAGIIRRSAIIMFTTRQAIGGCFYDEHFPNLSVNILEKCQEELCNNHLHHLWQ
eukprot:1057583-Ditylum_brightwellii.AAC.1